MRIVRLFLTGNPGSGKTSALMRVCESLRSKGLRVGGMLTKEIREDGGRQGFKVMDVATGTEGILSVADGSQGPRIGRYAVRLPELESIGVVAIRNALTSADIIVVDEVGPMELCSKDFIQVVREALKSRKTVIATLHKRARHPLIDEIRNSPESIIVEVTQTNRGAVYNSLLKLLAEN